MDKFLLHFQEPTSLGKGSPSSLYRCVAVTINSRLVRVRDYTVSVLVVTSLTMSDGIGTTVYQPAIQLE